MWWLDSAKITCFSTSVDGEAIIDPVVALEIYRKFSVILLADDGPAFVMSNGLPLSKTFMVDRTSRLLALARISLVDDTGAVAPVRAASWRAGGVRAALDANIPAPIIMAMGRWRSIAWESYVLHDTNDLQLAMQSMWKVASKAPTTSPAMRVGNLVPAVVLTDALAEFDDAVPCEGIERVPALHPIFYKGARSDGERRSKKAKLV